MPNPVLRLALRRRAVVRRIAGSAPQSALPHHFPPELVDEWTRTAVPSPWRRDSVGATVPGVFSTVVAARSHSDQILPPPNVTGDLHIGHGLTISIQDMVCRYYSMRGRPVRWQSGMDHSGIATQSKVMSGLEKRGVRAKELSAPELLNQIHAYSRSHMKTISDQLVSFNSLLPVDESYFTLDAFHSEYVERSFQQLYREGIIYRDTQLVNWDWKLQSTLSDIETDKVAEPTRFCRLHYPVEGMPAIDVVTTRPETIWGDTAVAVHPDDERYKQYHGKMAINPFTQKRIPIITDSILVNREAGTGVVKITPSHDRDDFACGVRHNLPMVNLLTPDGRLNESCVLMEGLEVYKAKSIAIKLLRQKNLLVSVESKATTHLYSSRTGTRIEPMQLPQWFLDTGKLIPAVRESLQSGKVRIYPEESLDEALAWLEHPQPWCLSRQIEWGHRIPMYSEDDKEWSLSPSERSHQDEDVLDTWFSSCLLPASLHAQRRFPCPLSVLVTGRDIFFFWVLRMMMLSGHMLGSVYLNPIVRDGQGRKMSKSLGNTIDPFDVIRGCSKESLQARIDSSSLSKGEKQKSKSYINQMFPKGIPPIGSDGLRFSLINSLKQNSWITYNKSTIEESKRICNKLWNVMKFLSLNEVVFSMSLPAGDCLSPSQVWILDRLNATIRRVTDSFDRWDFRHLTQHLSTFVLNDFCDNFLEISKVDLRANAPGTKDVLGFVFSSFLLLLHPVMPSLSQFISKELHGPTDLSTESLPSPVPLPVSEATPPPFDSVISVIHKIRSLAVQFKDSGETSTQWCIHSVVPNVLLAQYQQHIEALTGIQGISLLQGPAPAPAPEASSPPPSCSEFPLESVCTIRVSRAPGPLK